ncbi:MAG: hypothetical protein WBR33_01750, partial [Pseudonocardiaceae bacterium]
ISNFLDGDCFHDPPVQSSTLGTRGGQNNAGTAWHVPGRPRRERIPRDIVTNRTRQRRGC